MATWRQLIQDEMDVQGDSWENLESITLSDTDLDIEFDPGLDCALNQGKPFTAWTKTRVYFPIVACRTEWAASLSRHPDGNPTYHLGGG